MLKSPHSGADPHPLASIPTLSSTDAALVVVARMLAIHCPLSPGNMARWPAEPRIHPLPALGDDARFGARYPRRI